MWIADSKGGFCFVESLYGIQIRKYLLGNRQFRDFDLLHPELVSPDFSTVLYAGKLRSALCKSFSQAFRAHDPLFSRAD